ncbi:hypothetical protein JOC37_001318 [Desulfohalotomaculum tongense]|nr:hypothetical protein [Desulforadius tongensis]
MKGLQQKIKELLLNEEGVMFQYLAYAVIIGLGGASILFGILAALRYQGGNIIGNIYDVQF